MIERLITYIPQIRKAITGGVAAATTFYGGAQLSGGTVTGLEWVALAFVGLGGALLTWAVPNAGTPGTPTTP